MSDRAMTLFVLAVAAQVAAMILYDLWKENRAAR